MKTDWRDQLVHHWKYYSSPARPSASELALIEKKIREKGKKCKVLVLGATPEYREICGRLNLPIWLLDFSRLNYEYLDKEVKSKPKDYFIEGDWLSTVLDVEFDIILADNSLNVIKKSDLSIVFSNVSKMLKDDGWFIPRTYVREKQERYTPEDVIKAFRKEEGLTFLSGTMRNFFLTSYDDANDYVIVEEVWKNIIDLNKKNIITDEELETYRKISWDRNLQFFIPLREYYEKKISQYFNKIEVLYGTEKHLKDNIPLHVLTKK